MNPIILRTNSAVSAAGIIETNEEISVPMIAVIAGDLKGEILALDELAKSVAAWNGVPVSFRHPTSNGIPDLIRNVPEIVVGKLSKAKLKDRALHAVATFRKNVSPLVDQIIANIKAGATYEVSTGYIAAMEGKNQVDIIPDHLAILPDETGACSWTRGCGLPRQNHTTEGEDQMNKDEIQALIDAALADADQSDELSATRAAVEAAQGTIAELTETVNGLAATIVSNADGDDGEDGEDGGQDSIELPAELTALTTAIAELGGADGITAALSALKANSDAQRADLIAEIKANSSMTDADLADMSSDVLAKLATTVRPATWDMGRMASRQNAGDDWEDYEDAG